MATNTQKILARFWPQFLGPLNARNLKIWIRLKSNEPFFIYHLSSTANPALWAALLLALLLCPSKGLVGFQFNPYFWIPCIEWFKKLQSEPGKNFWVFAAITKEGCKFSLFDNVASFDLNYLQVQWRLANFFSPLKSIHQICTIFDKIRIGPIFCLFKKSLAQCEAHNLRRKIQVTMSFSENLSWKMHLTSIK